MTATARITTRVQQAARQPLALIIRWSHGNSTTEPMPTPEKAMPMARPRRRTNQLGRKNAWPV